MKANAINMVLLPISATADSLSARSSGITRRICDQLPSCRWFWGAGGALGIYYLPRSYTTFLNTIAAAIVAGRNLRQLWKDGSVSPSGLGSREDLKRALPPSMYATAR